MDDLSWAHIRQALETAATELRKVDRLWAENALINPERRRYQHDPVSFHELRQALAIVDSLLGNLATADRQPDTGWSSLPTPEAITDQPNT